MIKTNLKIRKYYYMIHTYSHKYHYIPPTYEVCQWECRRGELYILTRRQLIKLMFIKRVSYKQNETCKTMTNIYISDRDNAKMNILLFDI